jgi:hydroxyacid-oxoacid transhydrogenase
MSTERISVLHMPSIALGPGAALEAGHHLQALGVTRALLVTDRFLLDSGLVAPIEAAVRDAGLDVVVHAVPTGEPDEASMQAAADACIESGADGVLGVGGGSALDTAKVTALIATHGGPLRDWINAPLGGARVPPGPIMPLIAVPTTSGTGSEVTAVAVLDLKAEKVKTGIAHPFLRPRFALCDPELTLGLPGPITAATGIDALLHAAEAYTAIPYTSRQAPESPGARPNYQGATPLADVWVAHAIELVGRYLRRAVADGTDLEAREGMMLAATAAGVGFGNAGVHIPHACSYPIAGLKHAWSPPGYPGEARFVPHGLACAITAPAAFRLVEPAVPERARRAAELLTGAPVAPEDHEALPRAVAQLMADVGCPTTITEVGYGEDDIPDLVAGAMLQQRLLAVAPLPVGETELETVFRASL